MIPSFAELLGYDLDGFGITVCNIGGVNFKPYVKLASSLGIPFTIITDWDPLDGTKQPLGKNAQLKFGMLLVRSIYLLLGLLKNSENGVIMLHMISFQLNGQNMGYFLMIKLLKLL
ncbi:ATP-dependent endonuclease [Acinetobacter baumannii]